MTLILTGPPAAEPVTLADAKAWLRLDGDHEDELVASLWLPPAQQVERLTGLALIDQTWRLSLDAWPAVASVALSRWPVAGILELMVWGEDDEGEPSILPITISITLSVRRSWSGAAIACGRGRDVSAAVLR